MIRSAVVLLCLLPSPLFAQRDVLAITNITLIDASGAPAAENVTVVVNGQHIARIGKAGQVDTPEGAMVIDGTDKFLIPGLCDMHTHVLPETERHLPLFIANGVIRIRMMAAYQNYRTWRRAIEQKELIGPRLVLAGRLFDGPNPTWPNSFVIENAEQGREAVRKTKEGGYDFIKVYTRLPRDAFFAVAEESREQKIPFVGHVPTSVTAAEASKAGQKSIEHLNGVLLGCSAQEEQLRKLPRGQERDLHSLRTYDEDKAQKLFALFVKNETWQVPTMTAFRSARARIDDPPFTRDDRLRYVDARTRSYWNRSFTSRVRRGYNFTAAKRELEKRLEIVGTMHKSGVKILAGTDSGTPFNFLGFGLHHELELLVRAGLTPMEALQAATSSPAKFLGQEEYWGTIAKGKLADMIILSADPLKDITNTRRIESVIDRGRHFDRKQLDAMLEAVAQASQGVARPFGITTADEDLATLTEDPNREGLFLQHSQVTDDGLKYIGKLGKLKTLHLARTGITDAGMQWLEGLDQLENLYLSGSRVTGKGLKHIENLTELQRLYLYGLNIDDSGVTHLARLTKLKSLGLPRGKITDAGVAHLQGLEDLETLGLDGTQVSDAGLSHLMGLKNLKQVYLRGTPSTAAGVEKLRMALPDCSILK